MRGGMSVPWGGGVPGEWEFQGGWVFQGDGCSRGMSVLGDGYLGGWEFHNSTDCAITLYQLGVKPLGPIEIYEARLFLL